MFKLIAYNTNTKLYSILDTSDNTINEVRLGCILNSLLYKGIDIKGILKHKDCIYIEETNHFIRLLSTHIVGMQRQMNDGRICIVVNYEGANAIDVEYLDGVIKRTTKYNFMQGTVKYLRNLVGDTKMMNCGKLATVIRHSHREGQHRADIDIKFEDNTIVYNRSIYAYERGEIAHPVYSTPEVKWLGVQNKNFMGAIMEIIDYKSYLDLTVKFLEDNAVVKHVTLEAFKQGNIKHPSMTNNKQLVYNKVYKIGEKQVMQNGLIAEIIEYRGSNDIDVKFEDNTIVTNKTYQAFLKGKISHPIKHKKLGEKHRMNNGLMAEIIAYRSALSIDIKFEIDDLILKNKTYNAFKEGKIKHPKYNKKGELL